MLDNQNAEAEAGGFVQVIIRQRTLRNLWGNEGHGEA